MLFVELNYDLCVSLPFPGDSSVLVRVEQFSHRQIEVYKKAERSEILTMFNCDGAEWRVWRFLHESC